MSLLQRGQPRFVVGILVLLILGCSASPPTFSDQSGGTLTVFAAASLAEAFTEVGQALENASPGASVVFNFDGSQRLRTQLEHGAGADVFASANIRQMEAVVAAGLAEPPVDFAFNRLAVIVPSGPESPDLADLPPLAVLEHLAQPGVKLVLAQNEVPVGGYARESLEKVAQDPRFGEGYSGRVLNNLVSEETSVRSVAQKVALGEADAGIVYVTDTMPADVRSRVKVMVIPEEYNVTARYLAARLKNATRPELARAFIEFLRSPAGQEILARHGFSVGGMAGLMARTDLSASAVVSGVDTAKHSAGAGISRP